MVRHAPIHRRSGHSDIAICCGRNVRGSSPSTSVVPLSNQVTTLNHKRFKGFKMFSDGHSDRLVSIAKDGIEGEGSCIFDKIEQTAPNVYLIYTYCDDDTNGPAMFEIVDGKLVITAL